MVPNLAPQSSATVLGPFPALTRSTTLPANVQSVATDRSLLAPEDAIYQGSPPRKQSAAVNTLQKNLRMTNGVNGDTARLPRPRRHKERNRSGSRRRKGTWKKLLWVKQSCKKPFRKKYYVSLLMFEKIQTITPIKIPSWSIYNETPAFSHTISGH